MQLELELLLKRLQQAARPEDLFGALPGDTDQMVQELNKQARRLARVVHPDRHRGSADEKTAEAGFKKLNQLWQEAEQRIKLGVYNTAEPAATVTVTTRKHEYTVGELLARGDIANVYRCTFMLDRAETPAIFKVARDPDDNDLVNNEARVLKHLNRGHEHSRFGAYVPTLYESFGYKEGIGGPVRQASVLSWVDGLYSLEEVHQQYPNGIDPKDMAWIWRRLLVALGFAHINGVIHGAVLPAHVLIHPEKHGLVLVDWSYAVIDPATTGETISALSLPYEAWYPSEIAAKQPPLPGVDIFMAARCMVYALGGDPLTGALPTTVPMALRSFFRGCLLPGPKQRPQAAWGLQEEFDDLIVRLWGPKRFHRFSMPKRS